jgi:hypothetical protein
MCVVDVASVGREMPPGKVEVLIGPDVFGGQLGRPNQAGNCLHLF